MDMSGIAKFFVPKKALDTVAARQGIGEAVTYEEVQEAVRIRIQ